MLLMKLWCLLALASAELVRVNDKNFKDAVLNSGKFTLVDFYADWCRHCLKLMPVIEQLAETYEHIPEVQIVKINGDEDGRKTTTKYDIPGFPMLVLFNGQDDPVPYEGLRDAESISNFIQQVSGIRLKERNKEPSQVIELDNGNFEDAVFRAHHKTAVALLSGDKLSKKFSAVWEELAKIYAHDKEVIRFGSVDFSDKENAAKLAERFRPSKFPTVLFFDPKKMDLEGLHSPLKFDESDMSVDFLIALVNSNSGLSRNKDGRLLETGGRVRVFDELLTTVTPETAELALQQVEDLHEKVAAFGRDFLHTQGEIWFQDDVSMIPYYKKLVEKAASGSLDEFVEAEIPRLEKILLEHGHIMNKQLLDYMEKRNNILKRMAHGSNT